MRLEVAERSDRFVADARAGIGVGGLTKRFMRTRTIEIVVIIIAILLI